MQIKIMQNFFYCCNDGILSNINYIHRIKKRIIQLTPYTIWRQWDVKQI